MKSFLSAVALMAGILAPSALAAPPTTPVQRDILGPIHERQSSCHTASNRACWSTGFDINTDYEASIPNTGVTKPVRLPLLRLRKGD